MAFNDAVTDSDEFYGNTLYEHLKYRFTTNKPLEYLGPHLKTEFESDLDSVRTADSGKTIAQRFTELKNAGILTTLAVTRFNDFSTLMASYGDSEPTFGEVWYDIRDFERQILENDTAYLDDLEPVLAFASLMRAHFKYQYEIGQFVSDDRSGECFLGRKIECWNKVGLAVLQDAIKAALGNTLFATVTFALIKKAVWKAAGIAFIAGLIKIYTDKSCKCDEEEGPDPCAEASGVALAITQGCDDLVQRIEVYGQGTGANWYTWSVENGIFPTFNSTIIQTASSNVMVQQYDPNVPIVVSVKVEYENGCGLGYFSTVDPMTFDLPSVVNGTGTVSILGASTGLDHNDPTPYKYSCVGTWLSNSNTVMQTMGASYHGTTSGLTISTVDVTWTIAAPPNAPAGVFSTIKNICSNNQTSAALYPISIY